MEILKSRGPVSSRTKISSTQLNRKHLADIQDYKITVEYEPYAKEDDGQEPFIFRKSVHGSINTSGNTPSIRRLNFHMDDDLNKESSTISDDKLLDIIFLDR